MDYYSGLWHNPNRSRPADLEVKICFFVVDYDDDDGGDDREKRWCPFLMILPREEFITWRLA